MFSALQGAASTLSRGLVPAPVNSPRRVFYSAASSVKANLMPLYVMAGQQLDLPPARLRAIWVVESDEKPLTPGGHPVTRFEQAYWRQYREAPEAAAFDRASVPKDLDARWAQFEAMAKVDLKAAVYAHSWGGAQIMGKHHEACGYASLALFVEEMHDPRKQMTALVHFILTNPPLLAALRKGDARQVALHFNGPGYARNRWDVRWEAATRTGGEQVWAGV